MPAQKHSPSLPADSQEATEEEAKEVNSNQETESDLIFPAAIKQQDNDENGSWELRARTSQRKRTPTSIYTNKEETKKKGSRKKKKQEKTEAVIANATATMMKVAPIVPLIDKSMDLLSKMEGYWKNLMKNLMDMLRK